MTSKVGLKRAATLFGIVGVFALGVTGCGDDKKDDATKPKPPTAAEIKKAQGTILEIEVNEADSKFSKSELTAKAGNVTIVLKNPTKSKEKHNIGIKGNKVKTEGGEVKPGGSARLTINLKKGDYTFFDPTKDHAGKGETGKLIIE